MEVYLAGRRTFAGVDRAVIALRYSPHALVRAGEGDGESKPRERQGSIEQHDCKQQENTQKRKMEQCRDQKEFRLIDHPRPVTGGGQGSGTIRHDTLPRHPSIDTVQVDVGYSTIDKADST